jgi:hypothetical protein
VLPAAGGAGGNASSALAAQGQTFLAQFVEDFVTETFLPQVGRRAGRQAPGAGGGGLRQQARRLARRQGGPWGHRPAPASSLPPADLRQPRPLPSLTPSPLAPAPQVWVDLRGRCTAALEDPEGFRPQIGFGAAGGAADASSGGAAGVPILPAALFTEQVLEEVVTWTHAMPAFASSLTGGRTGES